MTRGRKPLLETFPTIVARRPYIDDEPDGYRESDNCFTHNNVEACVWFLENATRIRAALTRQEGRVKKGMAAPVTDPAQMTHSAMQRYVRIVDTVRHSAEYLTPGNRMELIDNLLGAPGNPTVQEIEARCKSVADAELGHNMVAARVVSDYQRGY